MKKKVISIVLISVGLYVIGLTGFLINKIIIQNLNFVSKDSIIEYLNKKYGDRGFYFVNEGTCNLLNLGYCQYEFSSRELNSKTFLVSWKDNKGTTKEDNYIEKVYEDKLNEYYKEIFINKYSFPYEFDIQYQGKCLECNQKSLSYDEFFEIIKTKIDYISVKIKPIDHLDYSNKDFHVKINTNLSNDLLNKQLDKSKEEVKKYVNSKYNFDEISSTTTSVITINNLKGIKDVVFLLDDCAKDEYAVSCLYTQVLYDKYRAY